MAPPKKYEHIDFTPPAKVRDRAEQGLALRREQSPSNKGGLSTQEAEGIGSGVQRAVNLKAGDPVSPEVARKMRGFFSRFRSLLKDSRKLLKAPKAEQLKSKMLVADLLWGGPEAEDWIEEVVRQMDEADAQGEGKEAARRLRRARSAPSDWKAQVQAFNDAYKRALRITDLAEAPEAYAVLTDLAESLGHLKILAQGVKAPGALPPLPSGLPEADPGTLVLDMRSAVSGRVPYEGDLFADWQDVKAWLPKAVKSFQAKVIPLLSEPAPGGSFTWEGFRVENRGGLPEATVKPMLDAVKQGLALLARRGLTKLAASELNSIVLHRDDADYWGSGGRPAGSKGVGGWYQGRDKTLHLLASQSTSPSVAGKMTSRWFTEVFLHEFGHHIHMRVLTPAGRAHWDDAWIEVERLKAQALAASKVTQQDVLAFLSAQWDGSGYRDWAEAGRRLSGLERGKYLWALSQAGWSKNPTRVVVTEAGKKMLTALRAEALLNNWTDPGRPIRMEAARTLVGMFRDWLTAVRELGYPLRRELPPAVIRDLDELKPGDLFRPDAFAELSAWINKGQAGHTASTHWMMQLKPLVGRQIPEEVWAFMEERDVTIRQEADRLLERLGVPTEYGKTDVLEDWAETFVLFVAAPDQLTEFQRWRMGRSLGISASQGKAVFARRRRPASPLTPLIRSARYHAQR